MRILTILQPCAAAMLAHDPLGNPLKEWENRPQVAPSTLAVGEWVALHAGLRFWPGAGAIRELWPECPPDALLPRGAIVGAWRYDGSKHRLFERISSPWAIGPWCYKVGASVTLREPIPWKGTQGWGHLPEDVAEVIRTQIPGYTSPPAVRSPVRRRR